MSRQPDAIETMGLTKSFGSTRAVDGVDLSVPAHSVYAVLGPNGAGKTTTIRMLATLIVPDGGRALVFGHDVVTDARRVRGMVGLTGQFASVDEDLTGWENLVLIGWLAGYGRSQARVRAAELLEGFDLVEAAGRSVSRYSGGMRRRLDIAAGILVVPDLLILDEPTTGLDPRSRRRVWDLIRSIVVCGTTVLLTTQYLDEADQLADRMAVIDGGRIIAEGTSAELKTAVGSQTLQIRLRDEAQRANAADRLSRVLGTTVRFETDLATVSAHVSDTSNVIPAMSELTRSGIELVDFALSQPSLDDVFLALTGEGAAPEDGEAA